MLGTLLVFYVRNPRVFGTTRLLLAVVAIDTIRNIVENIYFGVYFGGQRRYSVSDPRFLLRVITEQWGAFRDRLSQVERGFASELRDTGNRWAHNEAFSAEDAYRALDTIERLLTAIGAAEQASHVRRIRTDLHPPRSDG